jgi:aspartate/methionine/tyrosine aminotransferase
MFLSSRIVALAESQTLRMNEEVARKRALGERVYNLAVGEPIVSVDTRIIESATQAMREGKTRYPPIAGIPELKNVAINWLATSYQAVYDSSEVCVTAGGKFAIFALLGALLEPHDEALIIAPYWVSYPSMVSFFGGVPTIVNTDFEYGWKVTPAMLDLSFTKNTKLLILNNASNPTGVLYTREELLALLVWAKEHNVFVISDEVYSGLVYDGHSYISCGSFSEFKNNMAIVQSASKNFAMTGFRVGFIFAPAELISACMKIQGQSTTGTSIISQYATVSACANYVEIIENVRSVMSARRSCLGEVLPNVALPQSGLYVFASLPSLGSNTNDSVEFCLDLLKNKNVATVPGIAFGREGYVRLSFGGSEEDIREGVRRILAV